MSSDLATMNAPPREPRGSRIAPLAVAALLGGGVAAAATTLLREPETRTVVERVTTTAPATTVTAQASAPAAAPSTGMTVAEVYRRAAPGVVTISTNTGSGSGFVMDREGYIVTNAHVVEGASTVGVGFANDDRMAAKIVGSDPSTDLALLKVDAPGSALSPIALGASETVNPGDAVVAIGNPFGYDRTVTAGIVSAVGRSITSLNAFTIGGAIQTDAAINHGNSGGPLLNMRGEVIGVNAQITDRAGIDANVGVGFAIPVDTVRRVAADLRDDGKASHPWVGIQHEGEDVSPAIARRAGLQSETGVMVTGLTAGGPAEKAGLRPATGSVVIDGQQIATGGDMIVAIDSAKVGTIDDLQKALLDKKPGQQITIAVKRADRTDAKVSVTLGDQADAPTQSRTQSPFTP